jgi:hypothetical protein
MSGREILAELGATAWSVALAVVPLAVLFLIFQLFFLRLPRSEVARVLKGTLIASAGLFLFLVGVGVGYLPFGTAIGEAIGSLPRATLLPLVGLLLGFATAWGEPAVRILADQVESASGGSIPRPLVLWAICVGVSLAVAAGLIRIGYGLPLIYFVLPGYLLVMVGAWASDKSFVGIAIDAGGVATGPLANTFLLALALGAASAADGQDPLVQGLGLVSLIALAPVISVMTLGFLVRRKQRQKEP